MAVTAARSFAAVGAVVVVPQAGIPFRLLAEWPAGWAWNVPGSPLPGESIARDEPDDMAFMDALTTRLIDQHGVDPRRIHVRGFSGGARLASHLMAAMTNRLTSCVASAASDSSNPHRASCPRCWPSTAASMPSTPTQEAAGHDGLNRWKRWFTSRPSRPAADPLRVRSVTDNVRETRYIDTTGFAAVRLITVADAAHSSGTGTAIISRSSVFRSFDASQAHWDFVHEVDHLRHSLSAAKCNGRRQR